MKTDSHAAEVIHALSRLNQVGCNINVLHTCTQRKMLLLRSAGTPDSCAAHTESAGTGTCSAVLCSIQWILVLEKKRWTATSLIMRPSACVEQEQLRFTAFHIEEIKEETFNEYKSVKSLLRPRQAKLSQVKSQTTRRI